MSGSTSNMTRQRKNIPQKQDHKTSAKGVHFSDDRYSHAHHARLIQASRKIKEADTNKIKTAFISVFVLTIFCGIAAIAYSGYLETRVNTPFDKQKVVGRSGLSVSDRYWGSYRPGVYFGMKTREPYSPVLGLMWYFNSYLWSGNQLRHWCEQGDNLKTYGWREHDGVNFGVQDIIDGPFNISTTFQKRNSGRRGGDWFAHIADKKGVGEEVSLFFYFALDGKNSHELLFVKKADTEKDEPMGMDGWTDPIGNFSVHLRSYDGKIEHVSYLKTQITGLDKIREVVQNSLQEVGDKSNRRILVLPGDRLRSTPENPKPVANLIAYKVDARVPFTLAVSYRSSPMKDMKPEEYDTELNKKRQTFEERFEKTFHLKEKGFNDTQRAFAKYAFSNLIGGIGYFYGSSSVQSQLNSQPVPYWKAPLYTAVPSRSFFPRGFLWDEGFHGLLLVPWDIDIALDILCHWFDLMNVQGWIPREQILGSEALAKVPSEFVVQRNTNANPPTFFITLNFILKNYKDKIMDNQDRLNTLERLFPRLQSWFNWFNDTQRGELRFSYRWRGRDKNTKRELNPKTLTSGLDDYPRASHPTVEERHVDLRCWLALASGVMDEIAELLHGQYSTKYIQTHKSLTDNQLLDELHWSEAKSRYSDYGLHTDFVALVRPEPSEHTKNELERKVLKTPKLRFVDSTFGYVSIFPFILQILEPKSDKLGMVLKDIRKPTLLWTPYGLRSLSPTSPLYMERNTEHDPPYWRGAIWINVNYLACRALHHYANVDGPHRQLASKIYNELRMNIINNIFREYERTGYIWEQYSDKTGEGKGSHPFTGWSSLVVLLMAEIY